jgi:predicted house-cleaning noncanonical NTP pyrophosphatase (MazG superfamily)
LRKEYNKLVRDRIPEIILTEGHTCNSVVLDGSEYRKALLEKLIEEATEAAEAPDEQLVTELADLHEVIDAIVSAYGIDRKMLLAEQLRRREERGGFGNRILLRWTE